MTSSQELTNTIRSYNGEGLTATTRRIEAAAKALDISIPADGEWDDADADEICIAVKH